MTIEQLEYALKRANNNVFLSRRRDCGVIYYRPSRYAHDNGTPVDQRKRASGQKVRHLPILPERGWFASNPATEEKLSQINDAVIALNERMAEGESICRAARTLMMKNTISCISLPVFCKEQRTQRRSAAEISTQTEEVETKAAETQTPTMEDFALLLVDGQCSLTSSMKSASIPPIVAARWISSASTISRAPTSARHGSAHAAGSVSSFIARK